MHLPVSRFSRRLKKQLFCAVLPGILTAALPLAPARADAPRPDAPRPISSIGELVEQTFRYVPPAGEHPKNVCVAGDFNGWSTQATPMHRQGDAFVATVKLTSDVHHYKLVVDGNWMADPNADHSLDEDDTYGGVNSGVQAGLAPQLQSEGGKVKHTFRYTPPAGQMPHAVFLAGDFNDWSTTATRMHKAGDGFIVTVPLTEGVHAYKFVADGHWLNDPNADPALAHDDGNGGQNSGVRIAAPSVTKRHEQGINAADVAFDPKETEDQNVASADQLRVSFRAEQDNLTSAAVLYQDQDGKWATVPLYKAETKGGLDRFGGLIQTHEGNVRYVLQLTNGSTSAYVASAMAYDSAADAESHAYTVEMQPTFETPQWARHAIWYQIFPERFRNGDTSNDPPHTVRWTSNWFSRQPGESGNFYEDIYGRRYGGDLQGIRQELPYLRSLGVNAIYLNPIFQAESLHKYDATDYRHVDEHFGYAGDIEQLQGETEDPATWQWTRSDKLFLDVVAEAHRQGFHVIIDGVFNHVGTQFWAFQDVVKHGKSSPYAGWFDIIDWTPGVNRLGQHIPFHYRAWDADNGSLPIFKKDPKIGIVHGPREHILAIAKRWLAPDGDPSRGVDGFRLDAPENVPHPFWVDFRKTVKATKPDAYIDGEIWSWAQAWLSGDQFDAVMNYQFAIPTQQFFVDEKKAISTLQYDNALSALEYRYPLQVSLVNQNLLDSHDTDRVASMFANPDLGFNTKVRLQDNNPKYDVQKPTAQERQRMLQEIAMQMTFLGAPMIYYGDEAGMWGAGDPSDRQPMIWKDLQPYDDPGQSFDQGKFDWYQRLIALRNQMPALQTGFYHAVETDNAPGLLAFARTLPHQPVYVVINRSAQGRQVSLSVDPADAARATAFIDWTAPGSDELSTADLGRIDGRPKLAPAAGAPTLSPQQGKLHVSLAPWGVAILAPADRGDQASTGD